MQLATQSCEEEGVGVPRSTDGGLGDTESAQEDGTRTGESVNIPTSNNLYISIANPEYEIFNLYKVGVEDEEERSIPFVQLVGFSGREGGVLRLRSVFDDGAMANGIDVKAFGRVQHLLSELTPSWRRLRMADGRVVPSMGVWMGDVWLGDVSKRGAFEVFDSGGAWDVLFGKPLLRRFEVVHDYRLDTVYIPAGDSTLVLSNVAAVRPTEALMGVVGLTDGMEKRGPARAPRPLTSEGTERRSKEERRAWRASQGLPESKSRSERRLKRWVKDRKARRQGQAGCQRDDESTREASAEEAGEDGGRVLVGQASGGGEAMGEESWTDIWVVEEVAEGEYEAPGTEQPILTKSFEGAVLTRKTNPFLPARIEAVLAEVTIGDDLSPVQREMVTNTLREFADCFALSLSEVLAVEGAEHRLNIPEGATFRTKVNQRPLSAPQREYFNGVIDKMLEAEIIAPISHWDVKSCGATTLAKKAHEGGGLTIEELQHRVNNECVAAGLPSAFEGLPPRPDPHTPAGEGEGILPKWRICQDFADLNRATQVPALPQGDIRTKQQWLCGHRWLNVFDFASGFYACAIPEEDQPYVCFYVEGRGYFRYLRMPFGLTGAPSTFAEMTARALGDMVGLLFQLFVDDGGMGGSVFEELLGDLRKLLSRVRKKGLSLSATKSWFFVTEAVFAGSRVGPAGIRPDLSKLTAIIDWKTPTDLQNLGAFTGLTGYFRTLVKGYAAIAQPLTDLAKGLEVQKGKGKAAYRRAMKGYSLTDLWKPEHTHAFLKLKVALTCEPVLQGPKFDGTPFIVTTDDCKFGFAGMLTQRHTSVLPSGKEVTRIHPVAFASKRTSTIEERYQPYILEFAALKFSLDKFSDVVWGFPIELETDCQALRDQLLSDRLNSTHARWRDGERV